MSPADRAAGRRRGFGLAEMAIAGLLLALAMGLVAQTAVWLAAERRGAARRERALQEAANLMERLAARPWDELTPDLARVQALTPATAEVLRDGTLAVAIAGDDVEPAAKSIAIEIGWGSGGSGGRVAPVRLVAWVYRRNPGGPRP